MLGRSDFRIVGLVGKVLDFDNVVKVRIASQYRGKGDTDENGRSAPTYKTRWNTITILNTGTVGWAKSNLGKGDLVDVTGSISESSYGEAKDKSFTVDMVANDFTRLATKEQLALKANA